MGWESSGVVGFDLGPLLEGQMRTAKLKNAYNLLIIGPRGFGGYNLHRFSDALGLVTSKMLLCVHLNRRNLKILSGNMMEFFFSWHVIFEVSRV